MDRVMLSLPPDSRARMRSGLENATLPRPHKHDVGLIDHQGAGRNYGIRPTFYSHSTAVRLRYDHSTTYVTILDIPDVAQVLASFSRGPCSTIILCLFPRWAAILSIKFR